MGQAMSTAAPTDTPSGSRVGRLSVFSRAEGACWASRRPVLSSWGTSRAWAWAHL